MLHNMNKENNDISEELRVIRAEIIYRNDKINELRADMADEMKLLTKLLNKEQELLWYGEAPRSNKLL